MLSILLWSKSKFVSSPFKMEHKELTFVLLEKNQQRSHHVLLQTQWKLTPITPNGQFRRFAVRFLETED